MSTPVRASDTPYIEKVEAGETYAWCACGLSKNQPYCDGSHSGTDFSPVIYKAEQSKNVFFCGCKTTAKQPICDGSHNQFVLK